MTQIQSKDAAQKRIPISLDRRTFEEVRELAVKRGIGLGAQIRLLIRQALRGVKA